MSGRDIQATEAIKLILGVGDSLAGRLLLVDALSEDFLELVDHKHQPLRVWLLSQRE